MGATAISRSRVCSLLGVCKIRLNEQVRRNIGRFPEEFRFQLTELEFKDLALRSQIAISNERGGRRYLPSAVLYSDMAIQVSIQIMKAFVAMRKILSTSTGFIQRLDYVLVNNIIKSAKQSIILIDNYADDSVLTMLGKKSKNVKVTLLTKNISK